MAFLAVKSFTLPVNSFEELLDSDLDVIVFGQDSSEGFYKLASEGSTLRNIYEQKMAQSPLYMKV